MVDPIVCDHPCPGCGKTYNPGDPADWAKHKDHGG